MNTTELLTNSAGIETLEKLLTEVNQEISKLQIKQLTIENTIDQSVYFNSQLKNAEARTTERDRLRLTSPDWMECVDLLARQKAYRDVLRAEIDHKKRCFSVYTRISIISPDLSLVS